MAISGCLFSRAISKLRVPIAFIVFLAVTSRNRYAVGELLGVL